jgi:hypothetical protein
VDDTIVKQIIHQQRYRPSDRSTDYWVDDTIGDKKSTSRGIDPVIEALTTGWIIPSGTNNPPAEVSTQ